MSNRKKQFCPRGHDTFEVGRDSSYRCVRCKRDDGKAAYAARRDQEDAARRAEWAKHREWLRRQNEAWRRRTGRGGAVR
jgi:hypothetical protein